MIRKILLVATVALGIYSATAVAQTPSGTLKVALPFDVLTFDPQHFQNQNFPFIKNLYDSLIEYTPEGTAIPSLATSWNMACFRDECATFGPAGCRISWRELCLIS